MRVVIADDSVLLREGVARLLREAGFDVVAQAGDGEELECAVLRDQPDVAIVDIRMPPTHTDEGLRAAERIRATHPGVGLLLLSQHVRASYALELLSGGTDGVGYLLKDRVADLDELTSAVRRVGEGGSVLDPDVVARLVGRQRGSGHPMEQLSEREREVLSLMAEGRTNQAIAQSLVITDRTVEKHVRAIFNKLGLAAGPDDHRRVLAVLAYLDD